MVTVNFFQLNGMLLLLLLLLVSTVSAQETLSQAKMKQLIGLPEFKGVPSTNKHECLFLEKQRDSYSFNGSGSGGNERFHVGCCDGRRTDICGDEPRYVKRCCPGFIRSQDPITTEQSCNQRVLADTDSLSWLKQFKGDRISLSKFSVGFINSFEVESVLRASPSETWTIFAVVDSALASDQFEGFNKAGACTDNVPPGYGINGRNLSKVVEGTDDHKDTVYWNKCNTGRTNAKVNFTNSAMWQHIAPNRRYITDLIRDPLVPSLSELANNEKYPLKFTKYANGIYCIDCSPIIEANHESANSVVHIIAKPLSSTKETLAEKIQRQAPEIWAIIDDQLKARLQAQCASLLTVLLPKNASRLLALPKEEAAAAFREHVIEGLWCSAAMIGPSSRPMPTMSSSASVRFSCGASKVRMVQSDSGSSAVSDEQGEFDAMATNGVLHFVLEPLLPPKTALLAVRMRSANFDADSGSEFDADADIVDRLLPELDSIIGAGRSFILLLPTEAAFRKLLTDSSYSSVPEVNDFWSSKSFRRHLLQHHLLITEQKSDLESLSDAAHQQKVYRTAAGTKVADFVQRSHQSVKIHFMEAKVVGDLEGTKFMQGRIYRIDRVLLPPSSGVWPSIIQALYHKQKQVIEKFKRLAASKENQLLTLLLPSAGYRALLQTQNLHSHTVIGAFYVSYLQQEGVSIKLPTVAGNSVQIKRFHSNLIVKSAGVNARISDCGVRVPGGVICKINKPLLAVGVENELDIEMFEF